MNPIAAWIAIAALVVILTAILTAAAIDAHIIRREEKGHRR